MGNPYIFLTTGNLVFLNHIVIGVLLTLVLIALAQGSKIIANNIYTSIVYLVNKRKHENRVWEAIFANGEEIIAELDAEGGYHHHLDCPFPGCELPCCVDEYHQPNIESLEVKAIPRPPEDFDSVIKKYIGGRENPTTKELLSNGWGGVMQELEKAKKGEEEAIQFFDEVSVANDGLSSNLKQYRNDMKSFFSFPFGTGKSEVGVLQAKLRDKEIYAGSLEEKLGRWKTLARDRHNEIEELKQDKASEAHWFAEHNKIRIENLDLQEKLVKAQKAI